MPFEVKSPLDETSCFKLSAPLYLYLFRLCVFLSLTISSYGKWFCSLPTPIRRSGSWGREFFVPRFIRDYVSSHASITLKTKHMLNMQVLIQRNFWFWNSFRVEKLLPSIEISSWLPLLGAQFLPLLLPDTGMRHRLRLENEYWRVKINSSPELSQGSLVFTCCPFSVLGSHYESTLRLVDPGSSDL